jgi:hypothetical protein
LPIVRISRGRDERERRKHKHSHRAHSHDPFLIIQSFFATLGRKRPLFAPSENHKDVKKFRTQLLQVADLIGNFRLRRRMPDARLLKYRCLAGARVRWRRSCRPERTGG